ncbi:DinB family protein [Maribacter sp. 2308TA10-17]|uniref:DinB family protein n=1 Tax=Maribacter sp. 2308TA10-17 TaxID=3386276 RepID=UPI0039BD1EC0
MKNRVLTLFLLLFTWVTTAQTDTIPKTAFTKMYLPVWIEATEHCMDVAKAMPEEKYSYKPTEVSKTFAEQMVHIAAANKLLTQRYVLGMEVKPNTPDASKMTKAAVLALMKESFEYTAQVVRTIEQEKLDETCKMYHSGNTVSRAFAMFYVQDHLANHRAKSNLYLRINGIEPPEYTW